MIAMLIKLVCLEIHEKLYHSHQERQKVEELKEKNYRAIFKKRAQKLGQTWR